MLAVIDILTSKHTHTHHLRESAAAVAAASKANICHLSLTLSTCWQQQQQATTASHATLCVWRDVNKALVSHKADTINQLTNMELIESTLRALVALVALVALLTLLPLLACQRD